MTISVFVRDQFCNAAKTAININEYENNNYDNKYRYRV